MGKYSGCARARNMEDCVIWERGLFFDFVVDHDGEGKGEEFVKCECKHNKC